MATITWRTERRKLSDLIPWQRNPRQIKGKQAERLAESFSEFGQVETLAIGPENEVYNGHQRLKVLAAQHGKNYEVDVRVADRPLTEKEREKLTVLLHKGATGEFDFDTLANEFELDELLEWGFSEEELGIDTTPENAGADTEAQIDKAEELRELWNVQLGQMWQLGEHRLICGDCTDKATVERLMQGEKAQLCHADPPYGMGKEKDGIANDNLYGDKLDSFQMRWWNTCRPLLEDNASAYIWGNAEDLWRLWYVGGLKDSERLTLRNEIAWDKKEDNPTMLVSGVPLESRRMYHPTERCLFFMLGEQGFNNNSDNYWDGWESIRAALEADCKLMGWGAKDIERICGVGMYGHWFTKSQWTFIPEEHYKKLQLAAREHDAFKREYDELKRDFYSTRAYFDNTHDSMTDVWQFQRVTGEERLGHATPKPVAMMERAIRTSTANGDIVYVPFNGTAPELIACENLSRKCRAVELNPAYIAIALQRWTDHTGQSPVLMDEPV